jgi:uncharacterized protein involved in cysteine biosynthesis
MNKFFSGLSGYLRAFHLVRRHRMWHLLILPGAISLLYFPAVIALTLLFSDELGSYIRDRWLPDFLKQRVWSILVLAGLWILFLYLGFALFRNVILILCAPFLGYLSAMTEANARPTGITGGEKVRWFDGTLRAVGMSLITLGLSLFSLVFCVSLLLVPVVGGVLMALLLPATQMFLAGHGFMDPTLERRGFGVGQSLRFGWRNKLHLLGSGCGFVLLTAIPVVGWFLGPTLGTVAGTLTTIDLESTIENIGRDAHA